MAWESTVRALQRALPVQDPMGTVDQVGAPEHPCSRQKRLDNIATGLRVAGQPTVLETPAGGHTACVGQAIPLVLCTTKPINSGREMSQMVMILLVGPAEQIGADQPEMARVPEPVSEW